MNWEAIGAIGEIAGAVAVVVTLIYLSLQLRENTKSSKVHSLNQTFSERSEMMRELQSHRIGKTYNKIILDQDLTDDEVLEASWLFTRVCILNEKLHYLHSIGAADSYNYESFNRQLPDMIRNNFFEEWWPGTKSQFSEVFQIHIESIREDT